MTRNAAHDAEQLVVQSLFADGHVRYSVERSPARTPALAVLAIREEILPFFANSTLLAKARLDEEAEITDGRDLETKCSPVPLWFLRAVWNKVTPAT